MPISAVIITLNEEQNIARCILSVLPVVDEVVVLDSFSKDKTVQIAESLGARVLQEDFKGYGEQKIMAFAAATHDWILSIDADEELSPELQKSLVRIKDNPGEDAYSVNRLTNYCGKWIRHGGWYPDSLLRFWHKNSGQMRADKVHEGWELASGKTTGHLAGDLYHYSFPTISAHLKKIEQYSEMGAQFDVARGKKVSMLKLLFGPGWTFLSVFVFRLGFLDGYYGWVIAKNSAFASFAKYLKIREYTKK
ncbi:MAG: glycosyltransferase family 2 protein [Bacteroidetes bacterium]|nr:glycosyltransferase family 2 protein [Bacteroidota bacterium]